MDVSIPEDAEHCGKAWMDQICFYAECKDHSIVIHQDNVLMLAIALLVMLQGRGA